jgi:hypothetical protein
VKKPPKSENNDATAAAEAAPRTGVAPLEWKLLSRTSVKKTDTWEEVSIKEALDKEAKLDNDRAKWAVLSARKKESFPSLRGSTPHVRTTKPPAHTEENRGTLLSSQPLGMAVRASAVPSIINVLRFHETFLVVFQALLDHNNINSCLILDTIETDSDQPLNIMIRTKMWAVFSSFLETVRLPGGGKMGGAMAMGEISFPEFLKLAIAFLKTHLESPGRSFQLNSDNDLEFLYLLQRRITFFEGDLFKEQSLDKLRFINSKMDEISVERQAELQEALNIFQFPMTQFGKIKLDVLVPVHFDSANIVHYINSENASIASLQMDWLTSFNEDIYRDNIG